MNLRKKTLSTVISGMMASIALSGCASYSQTREDSKNAREDAKKEARENYRKLSNPKADPVVKVLDSFYIADGSKPIKYEEPLPKMNVTLSSKSSMTIHQIIERVRMETGVPIRLTAEVESGDDDSDDIEIDDLTMLPILPIDKESGYVLNHNGSFRSLLDKIAAQFDLSWKYESGQVIFFRYVTKAFDINALPGETQISANLSGGSGSFGESDGNSTGSSGGGGESSTSLSSSTSIWEALKANVEAMLSSEGNMVVSESTGKIIVKDRPYIIEEVEDYINKENADFKKQVMVNVKVLSISRSRGAGYDINWDAVSASLSSDLSFGLSGGGALNLDSGAAVISGAIDDGNAFEGSEAVVRAINSNTDSSLLTNVFVSTMNGQPAPLQVVKKQAYIKSVGTTTTETSTTSNIEQGTVNTGFSISLLPKIMDDDHILLQYSINLSDLQNLESVSSGDQTVQTPEIDTRDFLQKLSIKSGDTLVISGFERVISTYEKEIGGSTEALDNDMIVIIMTPVIVNR